MWTKVLLCVCAIAAASATTGWEYGSKYTYQVRGRTLTALHQVSDQYVGILTKAQLDIVAKHESQLIASLREAQFAKVQKNLPGGWGSWIGDEQLSYEPLPVSSKPIEIRLKGGVIEEVIVDASLPTWEINMIKGVVSQLQMDVKGKHLIESPENQLASGDNKNAVFKTMESAVTGRCEVQYDISALPEYVLQSRPELAPLPELRKDGDFIDVVKSTNFSRCAKRPLYNFGFPGLQHLEIGSNQMGDAIARSSVSRTVLSGNLDKYTIQSSVTTQKIIISPNLYNEQKGMIVSRMNVTLTQVTKTSEQPAGPENPRHMHDLVYIMKKSLTDAPFDHHKDSQKDSSDEQEDARMNSNAAKRFRTSLKNQRPSEQDETNWSQELQAEYKHKPNFDEPRKIPMLLASAIEQKLVNPVRSSISLAKQIAEDLQNPSDIPEKATLTKFNILSILARVMNTKQIQDVVHELYVPATHSEPSRDTLLQRAAWKAWRDAVAQAGTSPALVNIKEWIEKNMVHGMEAANMIASLPSAARYPDKEYVHFLFRLAENPQVKKDHSVYTAALFAFTTLLRRAHVEKGTAMSRYPAYIFGRLNPHDETRVDRYVDFYAYRLKKAVEKQDSVQIQTYIAILGNIGHPRVLNKFEPYLEGEKTVTSYQRRLMLAVLNNMLGVNPKLVRATAYRVYQSASEDGQTRALAAFTVMRTNPPASMIQRMAESTQFEQNEQVRSAIKTMVESTANLKAGEDWEKIANARAAVKNLNATRTSMHYSQGLRFSKDLEDMQMALHGALFTVNKEDSLLPHGFFATFQKTFNGIKMPGSTLGYEVSSMQNLWERLTNPEQTESAQQTSENYEHPLWSHNAIAEALGVKNNHSEPIEASFWLRAVGGQRFFAFGDKSIDHLRSASKHISTQLQRGEMKFNHSRLFNPEEMILTIPTPMGLPTQYMISTPMYYSVSGKVNAIPDSQQEQSEMLIPGLKKVTSDIHYVFSSKVKAQLMIVTPFDHKRYQSGIEKDMQVNLPIRAEFELSRENKEVRAMIQPSNPEQKSKLFIIRNRPYVAQEDLLKLEPAQQHIVHIRKPTQTNMTVGQDFTGMAFDVDYSSESKFMDFAEVISKVQKKEYMSAIVKAVSEPIQHSELVVSYNPEKSSAKAVILSAAYEKMRPTQEQQQQDEQQMGEQEKEIEELVKEDQKEKDVEWIKDLAEGHSKRQEILKSIAKKIKGSEASVFQLSAKFQGKTEAKFAATAAMASSLVNPFSRYELHLHQVPTNKQDEKHVAVHATGKKPLTPMTNYKKALDAKHEARLDTVVIMHGKGLSQQADKPAVIRIRTEMKQTADQREYVLSTPMAKLCDAQMQQGNNFLPACQNVTVSANRMNDYETRVEYRGVSDQVKNATYKAYGFARYMGWEYYAENAINATHKENALRIHTHFAPNEESVNITIAAPALKGEFQNIRISPLVAAASIASTVYTPSQMVALRLFRDQFYPSCVVDRKAMNTFSNKTYPLEIEGSWHVLLHTAYEQPARQYSQLKQNVTILARKAGASEDKEIRIILGNRPQQSNNVIELIPAGKTYEVKVNNQTVQVSSQRVSEARDENNKVFARMYVTPDRSLRVMAVKHNVEVLYRPSVTVISAANSLRNQVRGLCGTFNSEVATDFTTPKNCIVRKPEHFVASWSVMAAGKDAQKQQEALQVPCFAKTHKFANVVTEWEERNSRDNSEEQSHERRQDSDETTERSRTETEQEQQCGKATGTKVIKSDDQLCFSLRPQPICKSHCKSTTRMEQVQFHCLPKDSSNARHWQHMLKRGATLDLAQKPANKVMSIPVPESCQA